MPSSPTSGPGVTRIRRSSPRRTWRQPSRHERRSRRSPPVRQRPPPIAWSTLVRPWRCRAGHGWRPLVRHRGAARRGPGGPRLTQPIGLDGEVRPARLESGHGRADPRRRAGSRRSPQACLGEARRRRRHRLLRGGRRAPAGPVRAPTTGPDRHPGLVQRASRHPSSTRRSTRSTSGWPATRCWSPFTAPGLNGSHAARTRIRGMLTIELDADRRISRARAWALTRVVGTDSTIEPADEQAGAHPSTGR